MLERCLSQRVQHPRQIFCSQACVLDSLPSGRVHRHSVSNGIERAGLGADLLGLPFIESGLAPCWHCPGMDQNRPNAELAPGTTVNIYSIREVQKHTQVLSKVRLLDLIM